MLKDKIRKWIENTDIDYSELPSYHYERDPYCVGSPLCHGSECYEYDDDEAWEAKKEKFIEQLKYDGIWEYIDLPNGVLEKEQETERLTNAIVRWLENE